ncbi:Tyrosine-protein phosphatase 2 [Pleurostoma richardsiae]|uniref:Tyrosine-protein phosphatase 2 n=1 Tax=Pleurostoma richardsiae TaxID=41990 RepID=A0AA38RV12_9PEZI|nr:Tyrosine-protein phosphatase 2 [Pleurostoma richardsiae]
MDRLRFRRNKKDSPTASDSVSDGRGTGNTTPEPNLAPPPPQVPVKKPSPFRNLHFHRSGKRGRSPPPASLPQSPSATLHSHDGTGERPPSSPLAVKKDAPNETPQTVGKPPKIPAFLTLSTDEIYRKFQDIVWLERNRLMKSMTNPSPDFQWARVTGPHLKALDRYVNIQPWHNNRIKLKVPPGHIDYINASPITLNSPGDPSSRPPDRYIAMQGPKQSSIDHVWRMVVEQLQSPGVIVMLTETHEANVEKCAPYFPQSPEDPPLEVNELDEFGDGFRASVRCEGLEETPAGDAIELRKLVVRVHQRAEEGVNGHSTDGTGVPVEDENGDVAMLSPRKEATEQPVNNGGDTDTDEAFIRDGIEERIIWHFLYKKWPDFGVPNIEDLGSFFTLMRLSREKNSGPDNPRVVHCSAGVGRSGTFIALDHLIRELDGGTLENYDLARGKDDAGEQSDGTLDDRDEGGSEEAERDDLIFYTVNQLREQRRNMVQAESQFLFIYQVMRKLWQDKYGALEEAEPAAKRLEYDPFVER